MVSLNHFPESNNVSAQEWVDETDAVGRNILQNRIVTTWRALSE